MAKESELVLEQRHVECKEVVYEEGEVVNNHDHQYLADSRLECLTTATALPAAVLAPDLTKSLAPTVANIQYKQQDEAREEHTVNDDLGHAVVMGPPVVYLLVGSPFRVLDRRVVSIYCIDAAPAVLKTEAFVFDVEELVVVLVGEDRWFGVLVYRCYLWLVVPHCFYNYYILDILEWF